MGGVFLAIAYFYALGKGGGGGVRAPVCERAAGSWGICDSVTGGRRSEILGFLRDVIKVWLRKDIGEYVSVMRYTDLDANTVEAQYSETSS